jgi:hypothetical protein
MTPKEKAKELVLRFRQIPPCSPYTGIDDGEAKQCALIAVNEILLELECSYNGEPITTNEHKEYWQKVKTELKKL